MAISTGAAILGSAAIGAGVNALGASKAAKASSKANAANNAQQQQIYDRNVETLSPFVNQGALATDRINALLGLSGPAGSVGGVDWGAYVRGNQDALDNWNSIRGTQADTFGGDIAKFGQYHYGEDGSRRDLSAFRPASSNLSPAESIQSALEAMPGYQFNLQEGQKAVLSGLGARGFLDSGAAQKSLLKYGQNYAAGQYGNYLDQLTRQQGVGLTGASAQAGVSQNYGSAAGASNSANASNVGNAYLAGAGGVNNALGSALSAYSFNQGLGSSYGTRPVLGGTDYWNSGLGGMS